MRRPYTARECADYMGFTTEWIRRAITEGVTVRGQIVQLDAERLVLRSRTHYRIHEDSFIAFLIAIGWKHLPRQTAESPGVPALRPLAPARRANG